MYSQMDYLKLIDSQRVYTNTNTYMTTEDQKLLIDLLEKFFADHDINKRDMLFSNSAAKYLKGKLLEKGRWKNLPRGKVIDSKKYKGNLNTPPEDVCPF